MADFGSALTNKFMLGEATVMLGAAADLYKLNAATHSIGLVKNFQIMSDVGYVELTQGVQNNLVHSTMNKSSVRSTFEVYEYTAKNLTYALGLDGSSVTTNSVNTTLSGATTGTTGTPDTSIDLTSAVGFAIGDWIIIQGDDTDEIFVDKIANLVSTTVTLTNGIPAIVPSGSTVKKANSIALASSVDQPFLSMAAIGKLADGSPVMLQIPKVRITKGFTFHLASNNYGNMPFEATVYRPVSTDSVYTGFEQQSARLVTL